VPAAAVIPALIVYIKVVAVKKLVVGFRGPNKLKKGYMAIVICLAQIMQG